MRTVGIIAEYNPFHNGHAWQIQEAKNRCRADYAVVIMSPDFVQRGEMAVFDKYTRTRLALEGGADVVFELPIRYAAAGARDFARGGAGILSLLGGIDWLVFGCEDDRPDLFSLCAQILADEPDDYRLYLKEYLKSGSGYAAAREMALNAYASRLPGEKGEILEHALAQGFLKRPNNILGIEYCSALRLLGSSIQPLPICRKGAGHHDPLHKAPVHSDAESIQSAGALRDLLRNARSNESPAAAAPFLPSACLRTFDEAFKAHGLPSGHLYSRLLLYRLLYEKDYALFDDISADLALRIRRKLSAYSDAEQFAQLLATRVFPLAHTRRALLHLFLGLQTPETLRAIPAPDTTYVRLLGFRSSAAPWLHAMQKKTAIPVITKMAAAKTQLNTLQQLGLAQDLDASALYPLLFEDGHSSCRSEYTRSPIRLT